MRTCFLRLWQRARALLCRRDPVEYFIFLLSLGLFAFLIRMLIGGTEAFFAMFYKSCSELFMDFFHPLRDAARGLGVYTELGSIYPPLSNLIIYLLSLPVAGEYLHAPREMAGTWREYPGALCCYLLFFLLCFALVYWILWRAGGARWRVLSALLLCSFPFLFLVERGNTMLLCLAAMLYFALNYQSTSPVQRELALVALAFATAMKFYPVLLGAVLLGDRRWRDAWHAALYGLALLFLPSLFYSGPVSVFWAIKNTLSFSQYSSGLSVEFMQQNAIPLQLGGTVLYCFYIFLILLAAFAALAERKAWRAWMIAGCVMLTMPSIFSSYNWLLLLPALVVFLKTERLEGANWLYFFAMSAPFFLYPTRVLQDAVLVICLVALYLCYLPQIYKNWRELIVNFRKQKKF